MTYHYELADFKRYLHEKNPNYRVDGLIFWQNRIPLPIDLFNKIFDESDLIVKDYIYQIVASLLIHIEKVSFENTFIFKVDNLPNEKLKQHEEKLFEWVNEHFQPTSNISMLGYEFAEILGLCEFVFLPEKVSAALTHQGKKYTRLYMPTQIRDKVINISQCETIGQDNTDMFGNIIADRYNIYRSGFSDALAIIFNALLEFRILCTAKGDKLPTFRVITPAITDVDVRFGKTLDGSLWEPGYDEDHFIVINSEHPVMRHLLQDESKNLAEFLFFMGQYENSQFSDQNKKFIENMRQSISRSLWIKHD
ncbi:hypothetical protein ACQV2E_01450 [Pantoea allii]|uniref:hypothetical protein n=1 Tax=Pantoea allii TaxID=574096 RepID=UPI003D316FE5